MNLTGPPFGGELAALLAALLWAVATILFKRIGKRVPPLEMNMAKGIIASALLLITMAARGTLLSPFDTRAALLLAISGGIGIGLGDTFYFMSLRNLGSRKTLLLGVLAPPLAGLIALAFLGEILSPIAWLGILLAVLGVIWVISERENGEAQPKGHHKLGILFGALAALCQGSGAVISHQAMIGSDIDVFRSALLRLLAGLVITLIWLMLRRRPVGGWVRASDARRLWMTLIGVTFIGTFITLVLQQVSLRYTSAGVAQTLLATSPLFILPIAILRGQYVSPRAWLGVLLALAGITLLFIR
ncbi:MAG: DMT family transporter [bacterium]|nr:DMT family transporter [bacterium]